MNSFNIWIAFFLSLSIVCSQTSTESYLVGNKYAISGYYDYNMFSLDLRQFSDVADSVPRSAVGNNSGFAIGGFYEYRFSDRVSLMFRMLYSNQNAEIDGDSPENLLLNGSDTLSFKRHYLTSDLSNIRLEPVVKYRLASRLSIYSGLSFGMRFNKTFTHTETPYLDGATFLDGTTQRYGVETDKEDDFGLQAAILLGFSVDIPLNYNGKYLLVPEAMFSMGFSDMNNGITWDMNSLRIGASLMYSENPTILEEVKEFRERNEDIKVINIASDDVSTEKLIKGKEFIDYDTTQNGFDILITENIERVDTLLFPTKVNSTRIQINTIDSTDEIRENCVKFYVVGWQDKEESQIFDLKVEEFLSISMQPLLNYIFFESNSSNLSSRYSQLEKNKIKDFKIEYLKGLSTLQTYYQILNIVGKRMIENQDAGLNLIGCNSGDSLENNNLELSKNRAESVKEYLVNIWNISSDRIRVESRNLPENHSNTGNSDGYAENRRVEIYSDKPEILAPLIISDTMRRVMPEQIRFYNNINDCFNVEKWSLSITQQADTLIAFKGVGAVAERLIWRVSDIYRTIPRKLGSIEYTLNFYTSDNQTKEIKIDSFVVDLKTIEEKRTSTSGDKRIDVYSLIIFDYNTARLTTKNKRILDFINSKISSNSSVLIRGYTDRTGEEEYNKNLSEQRAFEVSKYITNTDEINYEGLGETNLLYNNELPEGRFYCRTVRIIVETPIEN